MTADVISDLVNSDLAISDLDRAEKWAANAEKQIPLRREFFDEFVRQIKLLDDSNPEVIEIGSGPGFLAKRILSECKTRSYTLIDISDSMHTIAKRNLIEYADKLQFLTKNISSSNWNDQMRADIVVTMQTIHEMNSKENSLALLAQIYETIRPGGALLLCDLHYNPHHLANDPHIYSTIDEHQNALSRVGFERIQIIKSSNELVFLYGRKPQSH